MSAKLQPVRGTRDWIGVDYDQYKSLVDVCEALVRHYDYSGFITPIFEDTAVFTKTLGDTSDIVGKEMYTFTDKGGESLTLRPEGTAAIVRGIISNGMTQNLPLKVFYHGPMFRYERPQAFRYRQLHQFGIECIGVDHPLSDVEVIAMAAHLFKNLGMIDKITLELNTLGDTESRALHRRALVDYFSSHKQDLSEDSQRRLTTNPLRILDSKDESDKKINQNAPQLIEFLNDFSKNYFERVCAGLTAGGVSYVLNPHLVRGLDYYNHTAFEFTTSHLGAQGTVLAGGRYNGLVANMGGPDLPGIGWAFGIERMLGLVTLPQKTSEIIAVIPFDEAFENEAFILTQNLRENGYYAEMIYTGNPGKRMKRADKMGAKKALILAGDEMARGEYILRDLANGTQECLRHENFKMLFHAKNRVQ